MKTVGSYEAKTHLPRLLREVEAGETIAITRNGLRIAILSPAQPATAVHIDELMAQVKELRKQNTLGGTTIRELVEDGRRY